MAYNLNIQEQELKNRVAIDYFWQYDCTNVLGNIDFSVAMHHSLKGLFDKDYLLWAEAKKGVSNIHHSLVQLILTIGKARTFDRYLPPAYLGAFDAEKIAFIPYSEINYIFYLNDFNWNVAPSNYDTREFKMVLEKVQDILKNNALIYHFGKDDKELKKFIKDNFVAGKYGTTKTKIDKNNFIVIYNKWLQTVKPTISVKWDNARKIGLIDGDFYLADLISYENVSLKDKLFILLKKDHYEMDRGFDEIGLKTILNVYFNDNQKAHTEFWNRYERPPKEEYWDYIVERRDLLVPQDIRERKGSFFTPQIWVELSQKYLAQALGEDWQDEYYVWDCAAGTGNLLNGLTNKYNIWASTLDQQDVEVMHDRIANGANLLDEHVFQFDFLNDEFLPKSKGGKIPDSLFRIISDDEERKKLVIYINPPYAEATTAKTVTGTGKNKPGVSISHKAYNYFKSIIGPAANEIFALFMSQIYDKIPNCHLALFSTLKFVQGSNFAKFREYFKAKFLDGFIVPANTFDNVKGSFPIGFTIWNLGKKQNITKIVCDVYDRNAYFIGQKNFYGNLSKTINDWIILYNYKDGTPLGYMDICGPDFQNNKYLHIDSQKGQRHVTYYEFHPRNIIQGCVYFSVRHSIEATWLNDRDQFLFPNKNWEKDKEFQNDCLTFTLFHGQNRISCKKGTNHWIPFSESEVNSREKFESNFMWNFINGRQTPPKKSAISTFMIFEPEAHYSVPLVFSNEAKSVFDAGRELWKYYHSKPNVEVNASLYDIREYFQGRNENGKMNNKSDDEKYNNLIENLRYALKILAKKIEPKIYEYGFLR